MCHPHASVVPSEIEEVRSWMRAKDGRGTAWKRLGHVAVDARLSEIRATGRLAALLDSIEILLHRCGRVAPRQGGPREGRASFFSKAKAASADGEVAHCLGRPASDGRPISAPENTGRENMIFRNSFSEPTPKTHTQRPQIHAPSLLHTLSASITLLFFEPRCYKVRLALVGVRMRRKE
jgi:hypothetical protein